MNPCSSWLKVWEWPEEPGAAATPKYIRCKINHAFFPKGAPHKNGKVEWR